LFNLLLALFFICSQTMPAIGQSQTMVSVNPVLITLDPGQTGTIDIVVNLGEEDLLRAFSVEIHFNPARLSADNLQQGDFLNIMFPEPTNGIDNDAGVICFGGAQGPESPTAGSGTLFSFDIQAKDVPGMTNLEIEEAELVDDEYFIIDTALQNGTVHITGDVNLTIAVSPEGGGTTTPAVGMHVYDAGAEVAISAIPEDGYRFENWSGDVATVANPDSETTTITMNGKYKITANFVQNVTPEVFIYLPLVLN